MLFVNLCLLGNFKPILIPEISKILRKYNFVGEGDYATLTTKPSQISADQSLRY